MQRLEVKIKKIKDQYKKINRKAIPYNICQFLVLLPTSTYIQLQKDIINQKYLFYKLFTTLYRLITPDI